MSTLNHTRLLAALFVSALLVGPMTAQKPNTLLPGAHGLVDLNYATMDQVKTLPGLDEATVKKIMEGRPYRVKNELVTRKLVPQAAFDKIKDQLIVTSVPAPRVSGETPVTVNNLKKADGDATSKSKK